MLWSTQTNNYSNLRTTIKQYELDYSLYFNVSIISLMTALHQGSIYTLYSIAVPFCSASLHLLYLSDPPWMYRLVHHPTWCENIVTVSRQLPSLGETNFHIRMSLSVTICMYSGPATHQLVRVQGKVWDYNHHHNSVTAFTIPLPSTCSTVWCD